MEAGSPILAIHEVPGTPLGCRFERLLAVTPREVQMAGLYKKIAVAWYPDRHNVVSCALALNALGAVEVKNSQALLWRQHQASSGPAVSA